MRGILAVFMTILPLMATADDVFKIGELGGGHYATVLANDAKGVGNDRFSGFALTGKRIFTEHVAVKGVMAVQENRDVSDLRSKSLDLSLLFGKGMGTNGWKGYVGPGVFSERWELKSRYSRRNEKFDGLHLAFGFGYNWEHVALDAWWTHRNSSDYEALFEKTMGTKADLTVMTFGLGLSLRFAM